MEVYICVTSRSVHLCHIECIKFSIGVFCKLLICSCNWVAFLCAVLDFKAELCEHGSNASIASNKFAKEKASKINADFCLQNAPNEINISSSVRSRLQGRIEKWTDDRPLISPADIEVALERDGNTSHSHTDVFQGAFKEIGLMLYQNIWTKFKNDETALLACEGTDSIKVYSEKVI